MSIDSQILMAKKMSPSEMSVMPMMTFLCIQASKSTRVKKAALWYIFGSFLHMNLNL